MKPCPWSSFLASGALVVVVLLIAFVGHIIPLNLALQEQRRSSSTQVLVDNPHTQRTLLRSEVRLSSRHNATKRLHKKKRIDKKEHDADTKKKARLVKRQGLADFRHKNPHVPPAADPSKHDPPSQTPNLSTSSASSSSSSSSIGPIIVSKPFGGAFDTGAQSGTFRTGKASEKASMKGKSKSKSSSKSAKRGKGMSRKKGGKGKGVHYTTYTPAPLGFRLEPLTPVPVPTATPSINATATTENPSLAPTAPPSIESAAPTVIQSSQATTLTMVPTAPAPTPIPAQPDISPIPGLITLTFPPTKQPQSATEPPTSAPPPLNSTLSPTSLDVTSEPSMSPITSIPSAIATTVVPINPTQTPTATPQGPTAVPTPDTGIRRIQVDPFYIAFSAPTAERAPVQNEFDFITQLTTLYFEEIFASLYRDAEFNFEMVEMTLLYTGYETSYPTEEFNLYTEYNAEVLVRQVNDDVELPDSSEVHSVILEAIDTTYVVNYVWNTERESPFYRTQDVVAGLPPLKLPGSTAVVVDLKGPRNKENVQIDRGPAADESIDGKPPRREGEGIVTSESYKQLASRFILPGSSIIEKLFENAGA